MSLHLRIITPKRIVFSGNVKSVTVPGEKGRFQILRNHAPIVSNLVIGEIKIVDEKDNTIYYSVNGGFVYVFKNDIKVISDEVFESSEIDWKKEELELTRLKEEIKQKILKEDVSALEMLVAQKHNLIKVARRTQI